MDIKIRHVEPDDHAAVHEIMLADRTILGTMRVPFQPLDYTRTRLESADGTIKLVAQIDDRVVGYCELITFPQVARHRHVGEINMIVTHEDWRGKGIGRALMAAMLELADNWLQLTRLGLTVWTSNKAAIELYEQFGFAVEGTMPGYVFRQGQYVDAHMMGRLQQG